MSSPQDFQSIVTEVEAILKAFGPWGKPIALALVNALVTDPSLKAILIGIISALPSPAISPQAQPASMSAAALSEQQQYVSAMTTVTFP